MEDEESPTEVIPEKDKNGRDELGGDRGQSKPHENGDEERGQTKAYQRDCEESQDLVPTPVTSPCKGQDAGEHVVGQRADDEADDQRRLNGTLRGEQRHEYQKVGG